MEHILKTGNFVLKIDPNIFESDLSFASNTTMEVVVQSDGFMADTAMDIDAKDLAKFSRDLAKIHKTLKGEAKLGEPYGVHMYLSFAGEGDGQIKVKGFLHKSNGMGCEQRLNFENCFDQTYLKEFSAKLLEAYEQYGQG